MKKKKKKTVQLINTKTRKYFIDLFSKKISYYKITYDSSFLFAYLININNAFNNVINCMNKNKSISEGYNISPSIFKASYKNISIKPFWNNKIQKLSDKLFLPSNDNLIQSSDKNKTFKSTCINFEHFTGLNSKYYQLKTKKDNVIIEDIIKCKQIKLFLNNKQSSYLRQIIGIYRYFYNRCVQYFNNYNKTTNSSWFYIYPMEKSVDKQCRIYVNINDNLYSLITVRKLLKKDLPEWLSKGDLKQYPSHLIDQAFSEACNRFTTCLSNYRKTKKPFKFSYKTKKDIFQTINLEKCMISEKTNGIFVNWKIKNKFVFKKLNTSERFMKTFKGCSITYHTVLNTFHLNMNYVTQTKHPIGNQIGSIDQGVKNPYVIYSPSDVTIIGNNIRDTIYKKCKEIDIINSRINNLYYYVKNKETKEVKFYLINAKRKRSLRKALHRRIKHIKNIRNELHNKTIKYICDKYKTIILPPFEIQNMVGKLNSRVSRSLYTLSFYKFKEKLKTKCKEYNIKVYSLNEPYTSKTCGRCGNINNSLGNADIYNCLKCKLVIGRDINGARNILLRNIDHI